MRISDWSSDVCSSDLQLQLVDRTLEIFELAGIGDADARRELDLLRHRALEIADDGGEIAPANIDIDPGGGARIFGLEHRRPFSDRYVRDRAERDLLPRWRQERERAEAFQAVDRKSTRLNSSH